MTATDPTQRPDAEAVEEELRAWLEPSATGVASTTKEQIAAIAKELMPAEEHQKAVTSAWQQRVALAKSMASAFGEKLQKIGTELAEAGFEPGGVKSNQTVANQCFRASDRAEDPEVIEGRCVVLQQAIGRKTPTYLWSGIGVRSWKDGTADLCAAHLVGSSFPADKVVVHASDLINVDMGSANADNQMNSLIQELLDALPEALKEYGSQCSASV